MHTFRLGSKYNYYPLICDRRYHIHLYYLITPKPSLLKTPLNPNATFFHLSLPAIHRIRYLPAIHRIRYLPVDREFGSSTMPIKLLPRFHFVNHSFPLMKLQPSIRQCRPIPLFSRVFPFKLKYAAVAFSSRPSQNFRAARAVGRSSESGRFGGSKSLVEDEAELSDWVSDLKTSSFRGRITSDEESEDDRRRSRGRDKDRDLERESPSLKRGRDRQSYGLRESSESRRPRGPSMESYSKSSRNVRQFKREYEDESQDFRSRSNGRVSRRENMNSSIGRGRAAREINSRTQQIPGRESLRRGGRDSKNQGRFVVESESEEEHEEEEEDDEGKRIKTGVRDFLSDEDSAEVDTDTDDDNENDSLLRKSTSALFPSGEKVSEMDRPRNSPGSSDSYLSETRYVK